MYKIEEKLGLDNELLRKEGPITIVAFGDSITHGVTYGKIDYENVYWNRLRRKINALNEYVPVNVINAGIEGSSAASSIERLETQVLLHNPDLVIVCFGLNDVNSELETYVQSLKTIFNEARFIRRTSMSYD